MFGAPVLLYNQSPQLAEIIDVSAMASSQIVKRTTFSQILKHCVFTKLSGGYYMLGVYNIEILKHVKIGLQYDDARHPSSYWTNSSDKPQSVLLEEGKRIS